MAKPRAPYFWFQWSPAAREVCRQLAADGLSYRHISHELISRRLVRYAPTAATVRREIRRPISTESK